jgi:hypothetical protein
VQRKRIEDGLLIDKDGLQEEISSWSQTPYRVREATFRVPIDASLGQKQAIANDRTRDFIEAMLRNDMLLASKEIRLYGPFEAHDLTDSLLVPGYEEWRVRAVFRYAGSGQLTEHKFEVPSGIFTKEGEDNPTREDDQALKDLYAVNFGRS